MSLRHIPSTPHPTTTTNLTTHSSAHPSAPSAPGLPDTLRFSLAQPSSSTTTTNSTPVPTITSTHPLESRLARWRSTQESLKMAGLRRTFGIAEPVRRGMELRIARQGEWRPSVLGGSAGVSGDVLEGRDGRVEWEDVFVGDETREAVDFHSEMESRLRMNW